MCLDKRGVVLMAVVVSLTVFAFSPSAVAFNALFPQESSIDDSVEPDTVTLDIELTADGTADWVVEYRIALDDDETMDAFVALEQDIEASPDNHAEEFASGIRGTVDAAESATEREMSAENFTVDARVQSIPAEYGIVTYSFDWHGFVDDDGDYVALDAIDSFFLDEDSVMIVSWEGKLDKETATPEPTEVRDTSVVWSGPVNFGSGEPRLTLDEDGEEAQDAAPISWFAPAVLVFAALLAGFFVWNRRRDAEVPGGSSAHTPETGEPDRPETSDEPNEELLSNEERVLRLLREEGGRIKQKEVVERLDWTDAKTSQVVGKLKDGDEVEVYRLGRENVLKLAEDSEE